MTISSDRLKSYEALITCFRKLLAPLPVFVKRDIERHLNQIDSLIQASRPPRFMIFGQRGAGKSSLINAIFGAKVAVARTIVCSRRDAAGVLAAAPIPIPNSLIVGLMQVAMVAEIIYISGDDFALASVGDFLANLGVKGSAGFVAGGLAGGIADFSWENLPGLIAQYVPELVAEGLPEYLTTDLLKCLPGLGVIIAGWVGQKLPKRWEKPRSPTLLIRLQLMK
jgi:uncharacterized protein (DUF697 family)